MNPTTEVVHAAKALTSWIGGVSTEVGKLSKNVASLLERDLVGKSKVDKAALVGLDEVSREFLRKNTFAAGAGAFFAAESIEEGGRAWEWWSRKESGAI